MIRIGRYGIAFGQNSFRRVAANWMPTPFRVWHFLCFWFVREARPNDVDKEQEFPTGTPMEHEGRKYRYWGPAPRDIDRGETVFTKEEVRDDWRKPSARSENR